MRPEGTKRLIASSFLRDLGRRVTWRAYEMEDGSVAISIDGKIVDEGERLEDEAAIARAEALAREAIQKAEPEGLTRGGRRA